MAKIKRIIYAVSAVLLVGMMMYSCRDENLSVAGEESMVLSAYKESIVSRVAKEYFFSVNTGFRIWLTNVGTDTPAFPEKANGIVGVETLRGDGLHYINLGDYNEKLVGNYDFYGLTDSTQTAPAESAVYGVYRIAMNADNDYTDYRRGVLKYDAGETSSVLRMPFKHIMSKINIKVMREEGVESALRLKSVRFIGNKLAGANNGEGIPQSADYSVFSNEFTNQTLSERIITEDIEIPAVGTTSDAINKAADLDSYLFIPESQTEPVYYMRVIFDDPENFYGKGTEGVSIDIPIYDNRVETERPLHFEQNTSYTLYITFLSNTARIVTLVPKVYEWIDGETESTDEDGPYQEQDFGQPVTFNGVMWSDRNVGATSAHPTRSMDDWNRSVGYFYQYGRNIPYFPNNIKDGIVDLNTPLDEALSNDETLSDDETLDSKGKVGGLIYPVINYESWGTTATDEKGKIAPLNNDQNKDGIKDGNYFYVRKLGNIENESRYWGFVYKFFNLNEINNEGWDKDGAENPCPPGWRLPTTDDFKGIIPGTGYSGNITFRRYDGIENNGSWKPNAAYKEPDFRNVFSKDNIKNYKGFSGGPVGENEQVYKGAFPCIFREEMNDPEPGSKSQYVLSMKDGDWNKVRQTSGDIRGDAAYVYNWGVIYGIKKQGTASAYRVKWEVKLQSSEASTQDDNGNTVYSKPFRGVLVISRYQTSKDDVFEPKNGSYEHITEDFDWEHPVEQLLLPVGGFSDGWSEGHLANIGTESWYAISDRESYMENWEKKIFWFKFCGTNCSSQTAVISDKSLMIASVQVRCVRDLK